MNHCPHCNGPQIYTAIGNAPMLKCLACGATVTSAEVTRNRIAAEHRLVSIGAASDGTRFAKCICGCGWQGEAP